MLFACAALGYGAVAHAGQISATTAAYTPATLTDPIVLPVVQIAFTLPAGAPLLGDDIVIAVNGGIPSPNNNPPVTCAAASPTQVVVAFVGATLSNWTFRVVQIVGAVAQFSCTFSGLEITAASLQASCAAQASYTAADITGTTVFDKSVTPAVLVTLAPCLPPPKVVDIDIRPGRMPNTIDLGEQETVAVAILSSTTFYAPSEVVASSLTFGHSGNEHSLRRCARDAEDVNGDGLLDLICYFKVRATGFQRGDTQGVLLGETIGGERIKGTDSVRIITDE
jgi:hypothetical protein